MQFSLQHKENSRNNQDKISERKYNMAQNKPKATRDVKITKQSKSTSGAKTGAKSETSKQKQENLRLKEEIKNLKKSRNIEETFSFNFMPYILCFAGVFLTICFIIPDKMNFLGKLAYLLGGLLSAGALCIPVCMIIQAFFWKADMRTSRTKSKLIINAGFILDVAAIWQLIHLLSSPERSYNPKTLFVSGQKYDGGGIIGGIIANFVEQFTGVGAWIIFIFVFFLLVFAMINITPVDMIAYLRNKIREARYNSKIKQREYLKQRIHEQNASAAENQMPLEVPEVRKKKKAYLGGIDGDASPASANEVSIPESERITEPEMQTADLDISPESLKIATGDMSAAANSFDNATADAATDAENTQEDSIAPDNDVYNKIHADKITFVNNPESSVEDTHKEINLAEIFTEDAVISSAGVEANTSDILPEGADIDANLTEIKTDNEYEGEKEDVKVTPKPNFAELYKFPSLDFLKKDPNPAVFTVTDELKSTAVKLVETLATFGVKTKITNICCGPTVTRYELQPEIGVRVKSIQNLSDDIALHLAASGVRIEAPIPGKDAVGIEIPNKSVSTVYIRNLIENPKFAQLKSKLSVCLGMDVAGSPVYMDIAKMPHLLIAGATGMGKSVCINSFIVSLLYKARPDECKLLLIDPKKVEFAVYNGMPHLLVPVVSDPKKAAGSLAWAVNEMERRFLLIEEVGVRDIDSYNEVTKNDPEKEYMPKIVIIIDELADLMMTAKEEVETSICRIAQKARAAGMHLVIGTQRPSVDVITGLIKANVPSRIACTVASQVDSRTIIDVSGAEKLLGRGDMLYAPVGCMKPIRVQGSFVNEFEIESIISFLKSTGEAEYDHDIITSIEREAEHCGEKKKGRGASGDSDNYDVDDRDAILNSDDAIFPAIEIAVDANMISTSHLQRKLSLGYSRAARIVDKLEKLGIVGPYEGSKPRKVLITRQEYLEMKMNHENR